MSNSETGGAVGTQCSPRADPAESLLGWSSGSSAQDQSQKAEHRSMEDPMGYLIVHSRQNWTFFEKVWAQAVNRFQRQPAMVDEKTRHNNALSSFVCRGDWPPL
jgi:hypothetical protein